MYYKYILMYGLFGCKMWCLHHNSGWVFLVVCFFACKYFHLNTISFARLSGDLFCLVVFYFSCFVFVHLFTASLYKTENGNSNVNSNKSNNNASATSSPSPSPAPHHFSPCGSTHVTDTEALLLEGIFRLFAQLGVKM